MILVLDTGNTHTKVGLMNEEGEILRLMEIGTDRSETGCEYAVELKSIVELMGHKVEEVTDAIISSVVPSVTTELKEAIRLLIHKEPWVIGAGMKTGLKIKIDDPGSAGADLVVAAVGAKAEYALPCIIIDMGTATTVTVLDKQGAFIGGAILPGANTALNALVSKTSLLPGIELVPPKKVIGANTVDCMKGGMVFGQAGALDGIIDRYCEELGEVGSIVATGGLSKVIVPYCRNKAVIDDQLLLKGLGIIWKLNQK